MSERLLKAFREEAELRTAVPAFEQIEQRGRVRRRRRQAAIGSVAASVLVVTGMILVAVRGEPRTQPPTAPKESPVPVNVDFTGMDSPPKVSFVVPPDWVYMYFGAGHVANRGRDVGYFGAVVAERVAKDPCQHSRGPLDFRPAATEPAALAAQLAALPKVRVDLGPVPDDRFGLPTVHLRLLGTGPACTPTQGGYKGGFVAFQDIYQGGSWPDPLGVADLWLVDVGDKVVIVQSVTGRETRPENRDSLADILDSVVITPPAPD